MIDKVKIIQLAEEKLEDGMFLVDLTVSNANVINVFVDGIDGVNIDQCIAISRNIEFNLDREVDDFELQVSSAGLGQPFKVFQQYQKNLGEEIEVVTVDGLKFVGTLVEVEKKGIKLETRNNEKVEGHKKKQLVIKQFDFEFEAMKSAKVIISFK
jgi:ribosome maturation factor RimP